MGFLVSLVGTAQPTTVNFFDNPCSNSFRLFSDEVPSVLWTSWRKFQNSRRAKADATRILKQGELQSLKEGFLKNPDFDAEWVRRNPPKSMEETLAMHEALFDKLSGPGSRNPVSQILATKNTASMVELESLLLEISPSGQKMTPEYVDRVLSKIYDLAYPSSANFFSLSGARDGIAASRIEEMIAKQGILKILNETGAIRSATQLEMVENFVRGRGLRIMEGALNVATTVFFYFPFTAPRWQPVRAKLKGISQQKKLEWYARATKDGVDSIKDDVINYLGRGPAAEAVWEKVRTVFNTGTNLVMIGAIGLLWKENHDAGIAREEQNEVLSAAPEIMIESFRGLEVDENQLREKVQAAATPFEKELRQMELDIYLKLRQSKLEQKEKAEVIVIKTDAAILEGILEKLKNANATEE